MIQMAIDQVPEISEPPAPYPGGPKPPPQQLKFGIFQGGSTPDQMQRDVSVKRAPIERIPASMPGLKALVAKCLQKPRQTRPSALQALRDPFFTGEPAAAPKVAAAPTVVSAQAPSPAPAAVRAMPSVPLDKVRKVVTAAPATARAVPSLSSVPLSS